MPVSPTPEMDLLEMAFMAGRIDAKEYDAGMDALMQEANRRGPPSPPDERQAALADFDHRYPPGDLMSWGPRSSLPEAR